MKVTVPCHSRDAVSTFVHRLIFLLPTGALRMTSRAPRLGPGQAGSGPRRSPALCPASASGATRSWCVSPADRPPGVPAAVWPGPAQPLRRTWPAQGEVVGVVRGRGSGARPATRGDPRDQEVSFPRLRALVARTSAGTLPGPGQRDLPRRTPASTGAKRGSLSGLGVAPRRVLDVEGRGASRGPRVPGSCARGSRPVVLPRGCGWRHFGGGCPVLSRVRPPGEGLYRTHQTLPLHPPAPHGFPLSTVGRRVSHSVCTPGPPA